LIHVAGDDEALRVANDSHLWLQAAVYTRSLSRAFRYVEQLRVANVVVNDSTDYWEAHEPFGGAAGTRTGLGAHRRPLHHPRPDGSKTVVLDAGGLA
jgi:succinate-semialdehyde dehydrogenase/glutarate-semialdehyde dehydrogenase